MQVWASPEALGRVYRNLIANTLRHGGGGLTVSGGQGTVCFSNVLLPGAVPDVEHLFDRFYQGSPARGEGGAGRAGGQREKRGFGVRVGGGDL